MKYLFLVVCFKYIYQSEINLKKNCKYCTLGQFIEKQTCSKAVWGCRQLWQNISSLCREYQMVGSQLGILFLQRTFTVICVLVNHCVKVFGQPVMSYSDVLRPLPILVCWVHVTQECYACSILAETSLQNDWCFFNVLSKCLCLVGQRCQFPKIKLQK